MMLEGQKLTLIVHLQVDKIDIDRQGESELQTDRQTDSKVVIMTLEGQKFTFIIPLRVDKIDTDRQ